MLNRTSFYWVLCLFIGCILSKTLPSQDTKDDNTSRNSTLEINLQWLSSDILKIETNKFTYQYFHLDQNLLDKKIFVSHDFLNIDFIKHALSDLVTHKQFTIEHVDDNDYFVIFTPKYPSNCYIKLLINNQDFVCDVDQIHELMQDQDNLNKENIEILLTLLYKEVRKSNIINNKLNHKYQIYDINKEFPFELLNKTQLDIKNAYDSKLSVYFDVDYKVSISQTQLQQFKNSNSVISQRLSGVTSFNNNYVIQANSVVKLKKYPSPDAITIVLSNTNVKMYGRLTIKDKFIENINNNIEMNIPQILKSFDKDYVFKFPFYIKSQTKIGFMNIKQNQAFHGAIIFEIAIKQDQTKCKLFLTPISYYANSSPQKIFPIIDGVIEGDYSIAHGQNQFQPTSTNDVYRFLFQCDEMIYLGDLYNKVQPKNTNNQQELNLKHFSFIEFDIAFDQ